MENDNVIFFLDFPLKCSTKEPFDSFVERLMHNPIWQTGSVKLISIYDLIYDYELQSRGKLKMVSIFLIFFYYFNVICEEAATGGILLKSCS